ncbi:carbohydrate binding domain-containing protein [Acidothermus cellulolyticus]|uniref:carbohydrate binding domain-containing protein n=1 Tax=Acidothermus cellulolyticus TaxID=28049 RepID=UPI003B75D1B4
MNGGFETGDVSGWSCQAPDAVVGSPVHSGRYALAGVPTGSTTGQCTQTVSVAPNTTYTVSAWVNGSYVYLGANGASGDVNTWTPGTGGAYQQLTIRVTTGPTQTTMTVYIHGWYAQPTYYADDITLT